MKASGSKGQGGLTLVEVLITLGLLAFVLVSLGKLQAILLLQHALGRQQNLALQLAGDGLASLRLALNSAASPEAHVDYLGPDKQCGDILAGSDTCFERRSHAVEISHGLWRIEANIAWHDRYGGQQTLRLYSLARAADPPTLAALYRSPVELLQPPLLP